jgi:FkbM family methyltransferase
MSLVRYGFIKLFNDPTCSLTVHGKELKLPLSHSLPTYLMLFPFYDRLPQRISEFVHKRQGNLNCIDVGANIGDTIAAFYMKDTDTFLAVEPNPKFNKLLVENWGWNKTVTIVSDICSSGSGEDTFKFIEKSGTAAVIQTESGIKMRKRSLDEIVNEHPHSASANVLKVDTDGHDFEVIAGSKGIISRNLPVVLFECDSFKNTNYVEDCLRTLNFFKYCGYSYFLLYDNYGYLMGKYSLSDLSPFQNLLFYQLTSNFYYFDILVMKDAEVFQFYKEEINYYVERMENKSLKQTAITIGDH